MKKEYQIYTYGRIKDGKFCRMIFFIDDNDREQFLRAETKKDILTAQITMSHYEAVSFIKSNKLKLIDEFKTKL